MSLQVHVARSIDATQIGDPLRDGAEHEAALFVAPIVGEAIALGAFARARSSIDLDALRVPLVRRACGGPPIRVGAGQLYVSLALRSPELLAGVADPARLLNRQVRPLLRALTAVAGRPAASAGRDVITIDGAPVAWVGVRHRRATGACGLEAIVSLETTFTVDASLDLAQGAIAPRFLGRSPIALRAEAPRVVDAILAAYPSSSEVAQLPSRAAPIDRDEEPFDALVEESIGLIGAAIERSRVALGGEMMVSDDVLVPLGDALFALGPNATDESIGACIDATFDERTLIHGVRKLSSIARVVRAAWKTKTKTRD